MNKLTLALSLAVLNVSAAAWAGPEHPDHPGHEARDWTDHNDSDPGVMNKAGVKAGKAAMSLKAKTATRDSVAPELSKIVVLCANEQEEQFEKEWKQYVDEHELKGPELSETIAWVSKEAASQRKKDGRIASEKDEEAWARKRSEFMRQVADRALNPAR